MVYMIDDKMPHVRIFFHSGIPIPEKMDKEIIKDAYGDLTTSYRGVIDFIKILETLGDGLYFVEEVIVAGLFITDAADGVLVKGSYYERAKYMRVNGLDMVLSMYDYRVLSGRELSGFRFDGDNGRLYKLRTKRVEGTEIYAESSHANDRSPEDE